MKTIKSVFLNGMNISSLTSTYCSNVEEELAKIALEREESEDMDQILEHFNEINYKLKEKCTWKKQKNYLNLYL